MALSDRNIVITPNIGQSNTPRIVFSGADAATGPQNITLQVLHTNSGTIAIDGPSASVMAIQGNGNVGIGFANPIFPLQIKTNTSAPSQALQIATTDWTAEVGSAFQFGFGAITGNTYSEIRALSQGFNAWNNLVLQSGGGNVGIGTTSPGGKLDVVTGTARWRVSNDGSGNIVNEVLDSTGMSYSDYKLYGTTLISYTSGAERMRLDSSGNLGIGTSGVTARGNLDVSSGANSFASTRSIHLGYSALDFYGFRLTNTNDPSLTAAGTFAIQRGSASAWNNDFVMDNVGNIGIGTSSPGAKLEVNGVVRVNVGSGNDAQLTLRQAGWAEWYVRILASSNSLTFTDASSGTAVERMRLNSSGNLGIGTTSPSDRLHVQGNARVQNSGADSQLLIVAPTDSFAPAIRWAVSGIRDSGILGFPAGDDSLVYRSGGNSFSTGTERLRITVAGNVGIGTATPTNYSGRTNLDINNATDGGIFNLLTNGVRHFTAYMATGSGIAFAGSASNIPFGILTNNVERMRVDISGNLGIGTTNITARLTVGDTNGTLTYGAPTAGFGDLKYIGGPGNILRVGPSDYASGGLQLMYTTSGSTQTAGLTLDSAGNVGIGTANPSGYGKFVVSGVGDVAHFNSTSGAAGIFFYESGTGRARIRSLNGSDGLAFIYGSTEGMRLNSSGNLGIGTSSISHRLHVSGTGFASSDFRAPIFYDSADTNWYLNPDSVSRLNSIQPYNLGGAILNRITTNIGIATGLREAITFIDGTTVQAHVSTGNGNGSDCYNWYTTEQIIVDPEKDYEFSYWVRSTGDDNIYFGWNEYNSSGALISSNPYFGTGKINTGGTWVKRVALMRNWRTPANNADTVGVDRYATSTSRNTTFDSTDGVMHSTTRTIDLRFGTCYGTVNGSKTYFYLASVREVTGHDRQFINHVMPYFNGSSWQGSVNFRSRTHWENVSGIDIIGGAGEFRMSSDSGDLNLRVDGWIIGSNYIQGGVAAYAPIYYDSANTGYYLDPASTSIALSSNGIVSSGVGTAGGFQNRNYTSGRNRIWSFGDADAFGISYFQGGPDYIGFHFGTATQSASQFWVSSSGGTAQASGDFRAPVFYDSNNTAFYFDGASTTNINALTGNGKTALETGDSYLRINQGSAFSSGIWFGSSHRLSTSGTYIATGSNGGTTTSRVWIFGGTFDGNNVISLDGGPGRIIAAGDIRTPIFYDSNNTNFYLDPASTSRIGPTIIQAGHSDTRLQLYYNHDNNPNSGGAGYLTAWASEPGISFPYAGIGANINFSGQYYGRQSSGQTYGLYLRFETASGFSELWSTTGSPGAIDGQGTRRWYIDAAGNEFASLSSRAPIFYDLDNTGYYTDPASTSVVNLVNAATAYGRTAHTSGHLRGGYNNIGASEGQTSPIYCIGSSYEPAATTLSNMYGIGFTASGSFFPSGASGWGMYVAAAGVARIFLSGGNGEITATGNITAYASDRRLKNNIKPITNALDKLMKINGVEFDWVDNITDIGFYPQNMHETGVIAQEIQTVIPDAVTLAPFNKIATDIQGVDNEYLTVDKEKLIPLLIEAIKEQQRQITILSETVNQLKLQLSK